jgi:CHASE3 domain sensor protein
MPGMIGSGMGYERSAMSGMARTSEQEQQRESANRQLDEQKKAQTTQMAVSGASTAVMIGVLIAALSAE